MRKKQYTKATNKIVHEYGRQLHHYQSRYSIDILGWDNNTVRLERKGL